MDSHTFTRLSNFISDIIIQTCNCVCVANLFSLHCIQSRQLEKWEQLIKSDQIVLYNTMQYYLMKRWKRNERATIAFDFHRHKKKAVHTLNTTRDD